MSLFAQQINMDIESLNSVLRSAIEEFDSGIRRQLSEVLGQFDHEISDVVKRLARSSAELEMPSRPCPTPFARLQGGRPLKFV